MDVIGVPIESAARLPVPMYADVRYNADLHTFLRYSMGGAIQNNYLAAVGRRTDGNVVMASTL